jgi:predicted  nucleic acid-binding Zn ribbon protein
MRKFNTFFTSYLVFLTSCASTPTGEWQYLPVDGFFKSNITESELGLLLRQSQLQCENELIKLKSQSTNKTTQSTGNRQMDAFRDGASMVQRMNDAQKINNFYPNCMELNGFKKTWVLYDVSSG